MFTPEQSEIPASIGDISVVLTDFTGEETDQVKYEVQVLKEDGTIFRHVQGDLVPHLTPQQISALQSFIADMRVLAQGLLP